MEIIDLEIMELLNNNFYIMVPALWVIGYALKQTPKVPNWTIIWILLGISLIFAFFIMGFTIDAVINGIIAAGVAVFGHQMLKQTSQSNFIRKNQNKDDR